jgi:hypothetical protein
MSEFSDDIMDAAKAVHDRIFRIGEFRNCPVHPDPLGYIAYAINAERERRAKNVEDAEMSDMIERVMAAMKEASYVEGLTYEQERRHIARAAIDAVLNAGALRSPSNTETLT